jgi:hypothetical protein
MVFMPLYEHLEDGMWGLLVGSYDMLIRFKSKLKGFDAFSVVFNQS